ncbi:hypothetical protein [Stutzerimonas stutzeri]|uniref:hypothetical protein n=1 Tax=Stutzerimonas stutzeri TaxID=316 RepID=UPI00210DF5EC|nr:hypothetical protein [Stutzerimonas stutzeri]MCQ4323295.1 hypothetical protein [Stutzerimonas stutzeri]
MADSGFSLPRMVAALVRLSSLGMPTIMMWRSCTLPALDPGLGLLAEAMTTRAIGIGEGVNDRVCVFVTVPDPVAVFLFRPGAFELRPHDGFLDTGLAQVVAVLVHHRAHDHLSPSGVRQNARECPRISGYRGILIIEALAKFQPKLC